MFEVLLSDEEFRILGGCINQTCEIDNDDELFARLGATREELLILLKTIRESRKQILG